MEDAAKKLYHRVTSLCKYLLCNTDTDSKAVGLTLQNLLERWDKYRKASAPGSYLHVHRLFTACKRSLGQGNVFTAVRLSTGGGVGFPSCITGHITRGVCLQRGSAFGGICLQGGVCLGGSLYRGVGQTPPTQDTWGTTGYGQQAGGTHPTGILSYLQYIIIKLMLVSLYVRYILK